MDHEQGGFTGFNKVEGGNEYARLLYFVAEKMRGAEACGWDPSVEGPSVRDLGETLQTRDVYVPRNDRELIEFIGDTEFPDEPTAATIEALLGIWGYTLGILESLEVDVARTIWQKMFVNEYTYGPLLSFTETEIMRHDIRGEPYVEGIFDSHFFLRKDFITTDRRETAYIWAIANYEANRGSYWLSPYVGVIQYYLLDFIAKMGKPFSPDDIKTLMLAEAQELSSTRKWWRLMDKLYFPAERETLFPPMSTLSARAYESCDVIILVFQMFSVYRLHIPKVLREHLLLEEPQDLI